MPPAHTHPWTHVFDITVVAELLLVDIEHPIRLLHNEMVRCPALVHDTQHPVAFVTLALSHQKPAVPKPELGQQV